MGLFGSIKSTWKQYEAVFVVRKLLEDQAKQGYFTSNPSETAKFLINKIWDERPDIFNGKFGQRPHEMSVAAIALSYAIDNLSPNNDDYTPLIIVLGELIQEWKVNGEFYPLNSLDNKLLKSALQTYIKVSNNQQEVSEEISTLDPGANTNCTNEEIARQKAFNYSKFEDWLQVYKNAAAEVNDALKPTDGLCLIDLMEDEPLRRAFDDKVDPKTLGIHFGKNFDILSMGLG